MIKLLVLDVDGCLSDGKIIYSTSGDEIKSFNVKDGLAIATWVKMGNRAIIITGRKSTLIKRRSDELKLDGYFEGVKNKLECLNSYLTQNNISLDEVAAIGDDLNDYKLLREVGISYTPNDGALHVKQIVNNTLTCKGGDGAVREMIEDICIKNNQMENFLAQWL